VYHTEELSKDHDTKEEEKILENLRSNSYFIRLCKGFSRYQELLGSSSVLPEEKKVILERMHILHGVGEINVDKHNKNVLNVEPLNVDDIFKYALQHAEDGTFDQENFLQYIRKNNDILLGLSDEWNPKSGDSKLGEYEYVNSLVAFTRKDEQTISLHILPAGTLQSTELVFKIVQGFKEIAQQIKSGAISCEFVEMKSWMLGRGLEGKIKPLFAKLGNVDIEDIDQSDDDVVDIQRLALLFNTKSLDTYLRTGEKPEVRAAYIESQKFVQAFTV